MRAHAFWLYALVLHFQELTLTHTGMLDIIEEKKPFGAEQWEDVASKYNEHLPAGWCARDGDSLKRKFNKMWKVKKPTGTTLVHA